MSDLGGWPIGRLLSTAARLSERALITALLELGVTPAGVNVLTALNIYGPMPQRELAELMRVERQTIGKTVERLEASDHLSRSRCGQDRRIRLVVISSKGQAALKRAQDIEKDLTDVAGTQLDELRCSLHIIISHLGPSVK